MFQRNEVEWLVVSRGLHGLSYFSQVIRCNIFPGCAVTVSPTNISHIPDSGHRVKSTPCPVPVVDTAHY